MITFFVAMGTVVGASLAGGMAAALTGKLPLTTMAGMAYRLKFWGTLAALGGAINTLEALESGLAAGELHAVLRQVVYILAAFAGAHAGYLLIVSLGSD